MLILNSRPLQYIVYNQSGLFRTYYMMVHSQTGGCSLHRRVCNENVTVYAMTNCVLGAGCETLPSTYMKSYIQNRDLNKVFSTPE